jgi:hypothetical protein
LSAVSYQPTVMVCRNLPKNARPTIRLCHQTKS